MRRVCSAGCKRGNKKSRLASEPGIGEVYTCTEVRVFMKLAAICRAVQYCLTFLAKALLLTHVGLTGLHLKSFYSKLEVPHRT